MDIWVVAAAAGAGYLAKYWQNHFRDGDNNNNSSLLERQILSEKSKSSDLPLSRFIRRNKIMGEENLESTSSAMEVASTSGFDGENPEISEACEENYNDVLSLTKVSSGLVMNGNIDDSLDNAVTERSTKKMGSYKGAMRRTSSLRTKRLNGRLVRPLSSLESCVMAQLYRESTEMKEYILNPLPSPASPQAMRPLMVSDGTRIISRRYGDSYRHQTSVEEKKLDKESDFEENKDVHGVPLLPKICSLKSPKMKSIKKTERERIAGLGSTGKTASSGKQLRKTKGSPPFLFCLGISIGILSSFIANKKEVEKLKELLKQTENLVQDLQEELEIKDSLTVQELTNDKCESSGTYDNPFYLRGLCPFYPEQHNNMDDGSKKIDGKESYDHKTAESSNCMSKIEAELEAELERLGLDINTSSMHRRLSVLVELDSGYTGDSARGKPNQGKSDLPSDIGNYAVSSRELTLRLHQVIQSRLEARVEELETALQNSQRKEQQSTKSKHQNSQRESMDLKFQSLPSEEEEEENKLRVQPLVMDLSGEALDAYNEAYEELMRLDDSEEECSPSSRANENRKISMEMNESVVRDLSYGGDDSVDEISDYEDEMEKQLIRQIVEKTRKGSPVVLNAQRWLFSMEKDSVQFK